MDDLVLRDKTIEFRRDLHRIPELDFDLPLTRDYLLSILRELNCEIKDLGKAGFIVYFKKENSMDEADFNTIAFRSDMDAIPVNEVLDVEYKSIHQGNMHACGHDGHMSILLGLALWVNDNLDKINYNCLLVFQAAEETTGGAKILCDTGIFETYKVSRIYGLHIWPGYQKNAVICRAKEFMAGTYVLNIDIEGKAAHIAEYEKGIDTLDAGCRFITKAYELETTMQKNGYSLLRFGEFKCGHTNNVVADKTYISGVMRAYSDDVFDNLWNGLRAIADQIEIETGAKFDISRSDGYPPIINPEVLYRKTKLQLMSEGFTWIELEKPLLTAEDFSYYQQKVPGLFMHLATGMNCKLHASDYDIDEDVLIAGVKLLRTFLID